MEPIIWILDLIYTIVWSPVMIWHRVIRQKHEAGWYAVVHNSAFNPDFAGVRKYVSETGYWTRMGGRRDLARYTGSKDSDNYPIIIYQISR